MADRCLPCPQSRELGDGARAAEMTSEEPLPIDSFRPESRPSEWGSGGGSGGGSSSSEDKDVVPEKRVGVGEEREEGPFTPGPAPREASAKKEGRGLFKPYEPPTMGRYTGGLSINAHEY